MVLFFETDSVTWYLRRMIIKAWNGGVMGGVWGVGMEIEGEGDSSGWNKCMNGWSQRTLQ